MRGTFSPRTGLARPHLAGRGVKVSIELNNYIVFSLLTLVTYFRLTEGTEKLKLYLSFPRYICKNNLQWNK